MFNKKSREKAATGFLFTRGNSNNNNSSKIMSEVKMPKIPQNNNQSQQQQPTSIQYLQSQQNAIQNLSNNQVHNAAGNFTDLPPPPQIPDMNKLTISGSSLPRIDENLNINQTASQSSHSIQSTPIPQTPKTEICVVDEGTPRHCEYLGSFEVKQFRTPEERGSYITQQLYAICNNLEQQQPNNNSNPKNTENNKNPETQNNNNVNLNGKQSWPVCLVLTIAGIKVCHGFAHICKDKKISK